MSLITAVLAKAMADQRGLDSQTVGRLMVTGYALGSVATPLTSALVVNQMVQQEPVSRPGTPQTPTPPIPALDPPKGLIAGDYVGKPFDEISKTLADAGVVVQRIDVKGSTQPKDAVDKVQVRWQADLDEGFQPLKAGDILQAGDTVVLAVSLGQAGAQIAVPDVVGFKFEDAASSLVAFKIERREVFNEKWDRAFQESSAGHVLSQAPAPGEKADKGAVILLTTVKPPAESGIVEARSFNKGTLKPGGSLEAPKAE